MNYAIEQINMFILTSDYYKWRISNNDYLQNSVNVIGTSDIYVIGASDISSLCQLHLRCYVNCMGFHLCQKHVDMRTVYVYWTCDKTFVYVY